MNVFNFNYTNAIAVAVANRIDIDSRYFRFHSERTRILCLYMAELYSIFSSPQLSSFANLMKLNTSKWIFGGGGGSDASVLHFDVVICAIAHTHTHENSKQNSLTCTTNGN